MRQGDACRAESTVKLAGRGELSAGACRGRSYVVLSSLATGSPPCVETVAQSPFAAIGGDTQCSRQSVGTIEEARRCGKGKGDCMWHANSGSCPGPGTAEPVHCPSWRLEINRLCSWSCTDDRQTNIGGLEKVLFRGARPVSANSTLYLFLHRK